MAGFALIFKLTHPDGAGAFGGNRLGLVDRFGHAHVRIREHQLGAKRLQQVAAFFRHRGGHRQHHVIAAGRANGGQGDAGVAAR